MNILSRSMSIHHLHVVFLFQRTTLLFRVGDIFYDPRNNLSLCLNQARNIHDTYGFAGRPIIKQD
jgi:hypothetical protein